MIQAQVVQHSVSPAGKELITLVAEYPRFIHGEVMTHRVFSRNAMSSRAVPILKMIDQVEDNPVVPRHWGAAQAGMQARAEVAPKLKQEAEYQWLRAAGHAAYFARELHALGLHKQVVNRLLEPFQWMKTIITATEWDNWDELRDHEDAEPHMQVLAKVIKQARAESRPTSRACDASNPFNWHLPFVTDAERRVFQADGALGALTLAKISAARCARVSYLNHDGTNPDIDKDLELYQRLAGSKPLHASPLEHAAFPLPAAIPCGNFVGWMQLRKLVESEAAA